MPCWIRSNMCIGLLMLIWSCFIKTIAQHFPAHLKNQRTKLKNVKPYEWFAYTLLMLHLRTWNKFFFLHSSYRSLGNGFWNVNRKQTGHRSTSQQFSFTRVLRSLNNLQTSTENINNIIITHSYRHRHRHRHNWFKSHFLNHSVRSSFANKLLSLRLEEDNMKWISD